MSVPGQFPANLEARFEVLDLLGQGGFGRVVLARDRELDRRVAIKIHAMAEDMPDAVERFLQEARVTARVEAPEVVRIYDHGVEPGGEAWIVYEYVPGETLAARLARKVRLPLDLCLDWGRRVALALEEVHNQGVVHRDIKPANVLIRSEGGQEGPVLCDFGLAWMGRDRGVRTQDGILLGTPSYMPPEVLFGGSPSPAGDQYAWAAVLYEMVYGRKLQPDPDPSTVVESHRSGRGPDFHAPDLVVPPQLVDTLARALSSEPSRRFPDLTAFARALDGRGQGTRVARRPDLGSSAATVAVDSRVLRPQEPAAPRGRRGWAARLVGVAALFAAGVAATSWWSDQGGQPAPTPTPTATAPTTGQAAATEVEQEARAAAERTLTDLLRFMDDGPVAPGPSVAYKAKAYIRERLDQYSDRFYLTKFQRYADALVAWAPLADRTPEGRQALDLHRRWVDYLVSMHEGAFERAEVPTDILQWGPQQEILAVLPKIVKVWTTQKERLRDLVDRLRTAAPDPSFELLYLESLAAIRVVSPHIEPILADMMRRAEEAEEPGRGLQIAYRAGVLTCHSGTRMILSCRFRRQTLRAIARRYANARLESAALPSAVHLLGQLVYTTFDGCPKDLGELELAALDPVLDQVEAKLSPGLREPLEEFLRPYPLQARPPSNTLSIRLERVEALLAKLGDG